MTTKLSETENKGDSVSLALIGDSVFTPTLIEDSNYTAQGEPDQEGVRITTKESFDIDGNSVNKFHTTRKAVVSKAKEIRDLVAKGEIGAIKCTKTTFANGKSGFKLVDA